MIYHFNTLFASGGIGKYYNDCCRIVPSGNWVGFWDSDVMVFNTVTNWGKFIEEQIFRHPEISLFTCVTGRIGTHKQRISKDQDRNGDMVYHRDICEARLDQFCNIIRTNAKSISGMMMVFKKETWEEIGGFSEHGILGVDTEFTKKLIQKGHTIGILEGMYVMHYYRLKEGNMNHILNSI